MFKKLLTIPIITIAIVGAIFLFRNFSAQNNIMITFADSKRLAVYDNVYLAGAIAGTIRAVEPTKNRKIAVTIDFKENVLKQLTNKTGFFIDEDDSNCPERPCLLIEFAHNPGKSISKGESLNGIDSALTWATFRATNSLAEIINPESAK